jgi:hypothetical protein
MKKWIWFLIACVFTFCASVALCSDENQWQYRYIRTTADIAIDSLVVRPGKRIYIESVWAWYDNAANTNVYDIEIVEGMSSVAQAGTTGRMFKYGQAMTSSGRLSLTIPTFIGVSTTADSTVYMTVSATGSDTLIACYRYKFIN